MRNRIMGVVVIVAATLIFSSIASAQTAAEPHALSGVRMTSGYRFYNEELSVALPSEDVYETFVERAQNLQVAAERGNHRKPVHPVGGRGL